MSKILKTAISVIPSIVSLFRKKTPEKSRGIVKTGVASLTMAGLISTGKLSAGGLDSTLLLILSILETIGYLLGSMAVVSGGSQVDPKQELLEGEVEGLTKEQSKALGSAWVKQQQRNNFDSTTYDNSLFDDDLSDLNVEAKDISQININN